MNVNIPPLVGGDLDASSNIINIISWCNGSTGRSERLSLDSNSSEITEIFLHGVMVTLVFLRH